VSTARTPPARTQSPAAAAGGANAEPRGEGPGPGRAVTAAADRVAPVLIPVIVMVVLGLWGLRRDSDMGNDEVATRWAAGLSLRQLAHLLRHVDAVHGLYYLLIHCWLVVGGSPAVIRVPSVLAMAVGVALAAIVARRLTGSRAAGLFAGLVMALTPSISFYAQTARSYALVVACVLAATLVLLRALEAELAGTPAPWRRPRAGGALTSRRWLAYGALMVLAIYLNEMAVLALAAHLVTMVLARPGRAALQRWLTASVAAVVIAMPLILLSYTQGGAVAWIARPDLGSVRTLFRDYFGPSVAVSVILLLCAVVAVLPEHVLPERGRAQDGRAHREISTAGSVSVATVALPLLVIPAGLLLAESLVAPPLYVDRYVLDGEAGAAILAGAGAARIGTLLAGLVAQTRTARPAETNRSAGAVRRTSAWWLPGIVVCVLALVLQLGAQRFDRTPASRLFNFGGPSQYIGAHARTGDGVLYLGTLFRKAELGYPADFRKVTDFGVTQTPMQAGNFRGTDKPFSVTGPLMLDYPRIWVIGAGAPSVRLQPLLLTRESQVLQSHFSLAARRHYRGITLTLWVRR
jgi:mannosyltransferase